MDDIEVLDAFLMRVHEAFENLKMYPFTHSHMREISRMTPDNLFNVIK